MSVEDRAPVSGATVVATPIDTAGIAERTAIGSQSDSDGQVLLAACAARALAVRVDAAGFASRQLDLTTPARGSRVEIALAPEATGELMVVAAGSRTPIPAAEIRVLRPTRVPETSETPRAPWNIVDLRTPAATTDQRGIGQIRGAAAGIYHLAVRAAGFAGTLIHDVELPLGATPLVVELPRATAIDVAVSDEDGRPLANTIVDFRSASCVWRTVTKSTGEASSVGFPAGTSVTVDVSREALDPIARLLEAMIAPLTKTIVAPASKPLQFQITSGRKHPVHVRWLPTDEDDELLIELVQSHRGELQALAQRLHAEGAAGFAELGATSDLSFLQCRVQAIGSRSGTWVSSPFSIVRGQPTSVILEPLQQRTAVISGVVRTPTGAACAGARISVIPSGSVGGLVDVGRSELHTRRPMANAITDADGGFYFDRLLPGEHLLEVEHPQWGRHARLFTAGPATEVDMTLTTPGSLRGTVSGWDTACGGVVIVTAADQPIRWTTMPDQDGRFEVDGLPPATYRLGIRTNPTIPFDPTRPQCAVVRVESGAVTSCALDLADWQRSVRIRVQGLAADKQYEAVIERLFRHDRMGKSMWRLRQPLSRSASATIHDLPLEADLAVVIHNVTDACTVAWADVGAADAEVDLAASNGVEIRVEGKRPKCLRLLPLSTTGTPIRVGPFLPAREEPGLDGPGVSVFAAVPPGPYRLVAEHAGTSGPGGNSRGQEILVNASDLVVHWQ